MINPAWASERASLANVPCHSKDPKPCHSKRATNGNKAVGVGDAVLLTRPGKLTVRYGKWPIEIDALPINSMVIV